MKSYTTQYATIYDKKVNWNFAKKDETTLQMTVNDWEKENKVEAKDHFDVKDALTKANTKLAGALTTLEESCLTASQKDTMQTCSRFRTILHSRLTRLLLLS